ncbi:MAG: hypothetical protein RLZZ422_947 [Pseudomonadota bacterium]|jgi:PBP1b-binding outer membrane lipoprotein LpoB
MKAIVLSAICSLGLLLSGCGTEPAKTTTVETTTVTTVSTVKATPKVPTSKGAMCPDDLQRCSDGTAVSRNPDNGCQFDACPSGKAM